VAQPVARVTGCWVRTPVRTPTEDSRSFPPSFRPRAASRHTLSSALFSLLACLS